MIKFQISPKFIELGLTSVVMGYRAAELVFNNKKLEDGFSVVQKLTYTNHSVQEVCAKLARFRTSECITIKVEPYYYRSSSVVAMTEGQLQINVNINGAKYRPMSDYLRNALHEIAHEPLGYGHGNNFPNGWRARLLGDFENKNFSVPYLLAEIGNQVYKRIL